MEGLEVMLAAATDDAAKRLSEATESARQFTAVLEVSAISDENSGRGIWKRKRKTRLRRMY